MHVRAGAGDAGACTVVRWTIALRAESFSHVQLERADVPAHVGGCVRFGDSIEVLLTKPRPKP